MVCRRTDTRIGPFDRAGSLYVFREAVSVFDSVLTRRYKGVIEDHDRVIIAELNEI
jgi:hypothetical protein